MLLLLLLLWLRCWRHSFRIFALLLGLLLFFQRGDRTNDGASSVNGPCIVVLYESKSFVAVFVVVFRSSHRSSFCIAIVFTRWACLDVMTRTTSAQDSNSGVTRVDR